MQRVTLKLSGFALAIFALLLVLPADAKGADCNLLRTTAGGNELFLLFPNEKFVSGPVHLYIDAGCTEVAARFDAGADGTVYAPDQESAAAKCNAGNGDDNQAFREHTATNDNIWWCHIEREKTVRRADKGDARWRGAARGQDDRGAKRSVICTGALLNETDLMLAALDGLCSGIQFQRVGPAGVGNGAVLNQGYLDAVDVWGVIGRGYEVCFPQVGRIIFLDAATAPRAASWVPTYSRDWYTCAAMDRAGTLALVKAATPTPAAT